MKKHTKEEKSIQKSEKHEKPLPQKKELYPTSVAWLKHEKKKAAGSLHSCSTNGKWSATFKSIFLFLSFTKRLPKKRDGEYKNNFVKLISSSYHIKNQSYQYFFPSSKKYYICFKFFSLPSRPTLRGCLSSFRSYSCWGLSSAAWLTSISLPMATSTGLHKALSCSCPSTFWFVSGS